MKRILYLFVALVVAILMFSNCSKEEKSTVVDWEGNKYKTRNYGGVWWMVENMRTTRTRDGKDIWVSSKEDKFSYTTPYCYFYNDNTTFFKERGCLYNWSAANEICPEGWRLPTVAEYEALTNYISSVDNYCYKGNPKAIAKAMAAKNGWWPSGIGGTPGWYSIANNASGFDAYAVGYFWNDPDGYFWEDAKEAWFWLEDSYDGNYAEVFCLYSDRDTVIRTCGDKSAGISVRCVRQSVGPDPGD